MEITEVKVRLVEDKAERLKAFCTITVDREFVVRDIKVIDGAKGLFVAMPSRKLTDHCPKCGGKNHLRAKFCNDCGNRLPGNRAPDTAEGGSKLHVDVAHPINTECRARFQSSILHAYHAELDRSQSPDYVPPDLDSIEEGRYERPGASHARESEQQQNRGDAPSSEKKSSFNAGLL